MFFELLAFVALIVFLYGLVSNKFEENPITPPMVFVTLGFLIGKTGLHLLPIGMIDTDLTAKLFEITLVMVLFVDGAKIEIGDLAKNRIPYRLLGLGIPLYLILGTLIAKLIFPSLSFWELALLSALLTPTDAALGNVAISHPKVPRLAKETITIESGLNDGLIVPVVLFLTVCESLAAGRDYATFWVLYFLKQIGLGIATGAVVGYFGARLLFLASQRHSMTKAFMQLSEASLAILAFYFSNYLEGNGFIAAFVAGIATQASPIKKAFQTTSFVVEQSQLLSLLTFLTFGAYFMAPAITSANASVFIYAFLSLTLIRILSVFTSLMGHEMPFRHKIFLAWMGPRGIASLVLGLMLLTETPVANREMLFNITATTVAMSIFLHGLTVEPIVKACFHRKAS